MFRRSVSFRTEVSEVGRGLPSGHAVDELWQRLRSLRLCELTTHTPYGEPHSRTLRLQNRSLPPGGALWFVIERGSDIRTDIAALPTVELEFRNDDDGSRVRISGQAAIVGGRDALVADIHGAREVQDDPRLALLRVTIDEVCYLDDLAPRALDRQRVHVHRPAQHAAVLGA